MYKLMYTGRSGNHNEALTSYLKSKNLFYIHRKYYECTQIFPSTAHGKLGNIKLPLTYVIFYITNMQTRINRNSNKFLGKNSPYFMCLFIFNISKNEHKIPYSQGIFSHKCEEIFIFYKNDVLTSVL